ncbi:hypothetical protein PFICI_06544 [Pestalotiopsis fici W106-1]|uniref:Xylanolytic transcriptional activator regulatory domain-containing protein n=1 Tax=Pestalotiopsis fici (strain W106-1 / CGMCC3.15140) TaxID=1229662 RepID=W3X810_PESFW|nr:uncharacterized protein PFICI_06544 [Pestalotiopsis fici W106-1]ETS81542.1 hypothetical protein PFICI_06544 [Pestalotiopsis fici W106-1]
MTSLFDDTNWRNKNADVLQMLASATRPAEPSLEPHELPPTDEARRKFDRYLEGQHRQNPFILRQDVEDLFTRVFPQDTVSQNILSQNISAHDLFRTFMILAIGSLIPFRRGLSQSHPLGFYLAAMRHFESSFLARGLSAIQDLLLIWRFGIYHHIGTSVWDIVQLCMRMCIEQGLHGPPRTHLYLLDEQLQRRVFWVCYVMDRYSSTTLDRPFAIADEDITVRFPVDADDKDITSSFGFVPSLDDICPRHLLSPPSETTVLILCTKLRRISSRIHLEFSHIARSPSSDLNGDKYLASGQVCTSVESFLDELDQWRQSAPIFSQPRCLFERQEWYDLLQAREALQLVRRAVDLAPKSGELPVRYILSLCLDHAIRVISMYTNMYNEGLATYTRSYFQMMFAAGLSVLFCVSVSAHIDLIDVSEAYDSLLRCEENLKAMAKVMPDSSPYVAVYEALHRYILEKLDSGESLGRPLGAMHQHMSGLSGVPPHAAGPWQMALPAMTIENADGVESLIGNQETLGAGIEAQGTSLESNNLMGMDVSQWSFLTDDTWWRIGNYAYGDPSEIQGMFTGIDLQL